MKQLPLTEPQLRILTAASCRPVYRVGGRSMPAVSRLSRKGLVKARWSFRPGQRLVWRGEVRITHKGRLQLQFRVPR